MARSSRRLGAITVCTVLLAVSVVTTLSGGDKKPDKLREGISGDYAFDLSEVGMGTIVLKFYVQDEMLWVRTASTTGPIALQRVVGVKDRYCTSNSKEGRYEVEFLKDKHGRYTLAHLKNDKLGIDTTGNRLKNGVHFPSLQERLLSRDDLAETRTDLAGTRVAVYFGRGMDGHSALAIGRAFQWMGCSVEIVDAERIKHGALTEYDVLAVPGGERDPDPWSELGSEGKSIVREFVGGGGGYIGICLGALLASNTCEFWGTKMGVDSLSLDMFSGAARCGQNDVAPKGSWPVMTELTISAQGHPIVEGLPERMMAVTYPNGPYFEPHEDTSVTVIAKFGVTGNPAMLAFDYRNGKVFLSGPHPEIEVDSERDGSSKFDELADEGSEWPLLLAAMKWITER